MSAIEPWLVPLHDATSMRETDRWAIEERGVPSLELMESAGTAVAEEVISLAPRLPVRIVAGKGNNGGDGFVAARVLAARGFEAEVLLLWPAEELRGDAAEAFAAWDGTIREAGPDGISAALEGSGAIVDAIFGTGFEGAPRTPADAAIEAINAAGAPVVSVDVPSGVDASSGEAVGVAVQARCTVTFHAAKAGHWVAPGKGLTGELTVAGIGIPGEGPARPRGGRITEEALRELPRRGAGSTKFSSGDVVVVGGSRGMTGAPCMAAAAAMRAGAGYAAVACPASLEPIFEVKLTEVMTLGVAEGETGALGGDAEAAIAERAARANAVVLGPGLGRSEQAATLIRQLASRLEAPLLIDADGLNALGTELSSLRAPRPLILTPHAGELARLLGADSSEEITTARLRQARRAAEACGGIVVLKGDDTIVTDGERFAVNGLASPGLATAGTGDVLCGVIAALLARGADPFHAACAGVLAHARAGRAAAARLGADAVIAGDVITALPEGLAP